MRVVVSSSLPNLEIFYLTTVSGEGKAPLTYVTIITLKLSPSSPSKPI